MATITASDNEFPEVKFAEGAAPGTPAAGLVIAYAKSDGLLYSKDDAGTETALSGTGAHIADTSDAHDASAISFSPTGTVAATDVQAAIAEVAAEAASGAANLASGVARLTAGDYTSLSSTTFADVDATNAKVTITTGARRVLVSVSAVCAIATATQTFCLDIDIDGSRAGQAFGLAAGDVLANTRAIFLGFSYVTNVLTAASHTFKLQYRVSGSSGTIYASTGVAPLIISAVELYAA